MLQALSGVPLCLMFPIASPQGSEPAPDADSVEELLGTQSQYGWASTDVLWALFEHDERTEEVVAALERSLRPDERREVRRVADTILNHWGVGNSRLSLQGYVESTDILVWSAAVFPWPLTPLDLDDEELKRFLTTPDAELRMRAAFTLLTRDGRRLYALRSILPRVRDERWIQDLAGAAVGEAIGLELAAAESDEERIGWLRILKEVRPTNREGAMDEVTSLLGMGGELGDEAQEVILSTYDIRLSRGGESPLHEYLERPPHTEAAAQERLSLVVARTLAKVSASSNFDSEALDLVLLCAARSPEARELAIPGLIEELRRAISRGREPDSLHVLRVLCHLDARHAFVRGRYLHTLSRWYKTWGARLDHLPCWKRHDEETLAAFDDVFSRAPSKLDLVDRLTFAGLVDVREHDIARRFLEAIDGEHQGAWAHLWQQGFRRAELPRPEEPKIARVNKLALAIATLKDRSEDHSEAASALASILGGGYSCGGAGGYSDYYEWGFYHAIRLDLRGPEFVEAALGVLEEVWPFSAHVEYAWALLAEAELTPEQAARMDAAPWKPEGPQSGCWRGLSLLSPREQDGQPRRASLRDLPRLRQELYEGKTDRLPTILARTPLIARDEGYLLAQMERGKVGERMQALELVRGHALDFPTLRAAVAARTRDCDHRVRQLAADLMQERGW